jgi:hypothetical protein
VKYERAESICSAFPGVTVRRKCWGSIWNGPGFVCKFIITANQEGCYPVGRLRVWPSIDPEGRELTAEERNANDWVIE